MKVTEITVHAGRTFNHPWEQFSNFKPGLSLKASLEDGEDPGAAAKALLVQAEGIMEDHKQNTLQALEDLQELSRSEQELASLAETIERAKEKLEAARARRAEASARCGQWELPDIRQALQRHRREEG